MHLTRNQIIELEPLGVSVSHPLQIYEISTRTEQGKGKPSLGRVSFPACHSVRPGGRQQDTMVICLRLTTARQVLFCELASGLVSTAAITGLTPSMITA